MQKNARKKILDISLKEFAAFGFEGARVDRIAQKAGVNKAMIFYYYSSKQNLHQTIIKNALLDFIPKVHQAIIRANTPEHFFETLPALYIRYFSQKKDIIKMIGRELIQSPQKITLLIREIFSELPVSPPMMLQKVIRDWYQKGQISESDPVQFIFNIIPLCLFPIIAKPLVEAIMNIPIPDDDVFLDRRIQSISNLLKRGMLK
jgi:AcrR family transcriptional regulator